jgi:FMN hydrolase / 5-amino-6-(5-phospho-D-ribitylamino)uracil phosphatase
MAKSFLDISKIKAITLDLDDTLWPVRPAIERAESALSAWLHPHAPSAAAVFACPARRLAVRQQTIRSMALCEHDLSTIRRESIRLALYQAGEATHLAEPAFDVFFAERMRVELYDDVRPALAFLAARFPIVALTNGNADVHRVGVGEFFSGSFSAQTFGVGKPDVRIFHAAASSVAVVPHEVLHVGDDAALDVLGALGAGMQTVWVNREGHPWPHTGPHARQPHTAVASLQQLCDFLVSAAPDF